jgi:hypothetical protein
MNDKDKELLLSKITKLEENLKNYPHLIDEFPELEKTLSLLHKKVAYDEVLDKQGGFVLFDRGILKDLVNFAKHIDMFVSGMQKLSTDSGMASKLLTTEMLHSGSNNIATALEKIKEASNLGYRCFVFELIDEDFNVLDFSVNPEQIQSLTDQIGIETRIAIYLKTKKHVTSDSEKEIEDAFFQITKCLDFIRAFQFFGAQEFPIILHVGGAKGNRKSTMEDFCQKVTLRLKHEEVQCLAVVNDEKPSLFSVKDLLPGIFYKVNIPIVFRSTSYPTNQGNLTLNESLLLAASTWKRTVNPLFIYLPGKVKLEDESSRPFGLDMDVVFDNVLPNP